MSILNKILQKRGITESELSSDEKIQFDNWKQILLEDDVTVDKIKEFCERMVSTIEGKWLSFDITEDRKKELMPYHIVYKALLGMINSSGVERERLEKYLNQLIEH
jgi:signal recognition particle GTPase